MQDLDISGTLSPRSLKTRQEDSDNGFSGSDEEREETAKSPTKKLDVLRDFEIGDEDDDAMMVDHDAKHDETDPHQNNQPALSESEEALANGQAEEKDGGEDEWSLDFAADDLDNKFTASQPVRMSNASRGEEEKYDSDFEFEDQPTQKSDAESEDEDWGWEDDERGNPPQVKEQEQ